ncbi:MAG TPA: O-antigen ligase family protein [Emticicia sp.]
MIGKLIYKFLGFNGGKPTYIELSPFVSLFLMVAYSFNILPPSFSLYVGGGLTSEDINPLFNKFFWLASILMTLPLWLQGSSHAMRSIYFRAFPLIVLTFLLLISTLWSLSPIDTARRSILELFVIFTVLSNVAGLRKLEDLFVIVYKVAAITLFFEIFMLFKANGFDEMGFFRGVHTQKNVLGLLAAISILFGIFVRLNALAKSKFLNNLYLLLWLMLLWLSKSKTSLGLVVISPILAMLIIDKGRIGITLYVSFLVIYCAITIAIILGVDVSQSINQYIHKVGFTGRDDIWQFLFGRFLDRPWLGHGYGGFWDIGPMAPNIRYGTGFIPFINQAHNGYLDLLLALGLVGFTLYLFVLFGVILCIRSANNHPQKNILTFSWVLIVFSLLHNFTETTLLRGYSTVWIVQLMAMAIIYRMSYESALSKV